MTKSLEPGTMNDIEIIPGNTNILLIAPHGHKKDDENTGALTRLVAKHCGCYAIINEFYRKPGKDKKTGPDNNRIDLRNRS